MQLTDNERSHFHQYTHIRSVWNRSLWMDWVLVEKFSFAQLKLEEKRTWPVAIDMVLMRTWNENSIEKMKCIFQTIELRTNSRSVHCNSYVHKYQNEKGIHFDAKKLRLVPAAEHCYFECIWRPFDIRSSTVRCLLKHACCTTAIDRLHDVHENFFIQNCNKIVAYIELNLHVNQFVAAKWF